MSDFIGNSNDFETKIEFYGISKTIEILNKQLEQFIAETEYCHIDEITRVVLLIIELNKQIDNKNKCFLSVKGSDKE